MKKARLFIVLCLVAFALLGFLIGCSLSAPSDVRPAAVAGSFYPADPGKLKLAIKSFLEESPDLDIKAPIGIIAPHAGYVYAGQIYADAYRQVSGRRYDTVVILGTNHTTGRFSGVSLGDYSAFRTPLGVVPIDQEFVSDLLRECKDCKQYREVHIKEHSIEVQIPFIQTLFPQAKIVTAIIHPPDPDLCNRFGEVLGKILKNRRALIVISTDLSHYPSSQEATQIDRQTLETITSLDTTQIASLMKNLNAPNLDTRACGEAAILAGLRAAKSLGAKSAVVAGYANSGNIELEEQPRVVGYGAVIIAESERLKALEPMKPPSAATPLNNSEKKSLLAFARKTIYQRLTTTMVPLSRSLPARMLFHQGAFVTLKKNGELRGCIGQMSSDYELGKTVGAMAAYAAFKDSRFQPVQESELSQIEIEISILSPMKPITSSEEIVIGRDGVLMTKGSTSAVFLPQVAVENNWNRNEMLDNLCLKAGVSRGCWKREAEFKIFQADVFSESQFKNK
jgi:MEMO1 family protein